jgi:glycosyltransferase involved in cell wall biosynthesis
MVANKGNITWLSYLVVDMQLHTSRALEIMRHMESRGYHNTLIASRSASSVPLRKNSQHLILVPIRNKSFISQIIFALAVLFYLPFYIAASKPRYIIVSCDFSIIGTIPCALFARLLKTKFILDIRSTPVDLQTTLSASIRRLIFHVAVLIAKNVFSGLTIITSAMKEELCYSYKINPNKIGIWTSGVSFDLFDPDKYLNSGNQLKHKLNLDGKFVVFYHGSLSDHRGITKAAEAMNLVRQQYPDVVLFLLGSPKYSKLVELLNEKGLHEWVIIHSPVAYEDVPKFVSISDLCIIPLPDLSIWRAQSPLKLLEYLAMEKVVIVSNIPANSEVIGTEACGIYLQSVNPFEIAKSIEIAYNNRSSLADWGKSGHNIVQNKYTWERVAQNFESYLNSIG